MLLIFYGLLWALEVWMMYRYAYKDHSMRQKLITSSVFLLTGLYFSLSSGLFTSPYILLILGGLLFSLIGDYALAFDLGQYKGLPGVIFFGLAHISYIAAYIIRFPLKLTTLLFLIPWLIVFLIFLWIICKHDMHHDANTPFLLFYGMILDAMVMLGLRVALLSIVAGGISILYGILLAIGVVSFLISDICVFFAMYKGQQNFTIKGHTYSVDAIGLPTYFGAQMLIAIGILI